MKPIIIAEAGINHNGSLTTAAQLADVFTTLGADYVKFQMRTPDICVPDHMKEQPKTWLGKSMTYLEYKHALEFNWKQWNTLRTGRNNLFASVWDYPAMAMHLQVFGNSMVKIPSAMLTNHDLLQEAFSRFRHVIVSIGMSTLEEVEDFFRLVARTSKIDAVRRISVLDCHSSYPTPEDEIDLTRLVSLSRDWPRRINNRIDMDYGYSSHSRSYLPPVYAALLGASVIEVHVTLNKSQEGSDHRASLDTFDFTKMVREVENVSNYMRFSGTISLRESEIQSREKLRGSW